MTHILIIYPKFNIYGGAELLIVRLCNHLTKNKIKNTILTTKILPEIKKDLNNTNIIVSENKFPNKILGEIISLHKGVKQYKDEFDVINPHNFPANIVSFPYKKPIVWMCNEPELYLKLKNRYLSNNYKIYFQLLLFIEKLIIKHHVKNIVVADKFNADRIKKLYGKNPKIINYGIDYDFFSKGNAEKAKEKFHLANKFVILQVGWLNPFKNQMASIETVCKLKDKIPNILLILAGYGKGKYLNLIKNIIKKNNLETKVKITGHLNRNEIRDLYHACDVLIHPIKSQGGWLAPFEAICAKTPIVVSHEMSASQIIRNNNLGIVTDDFAEAILNIYNNRDIYYKEALRRAYWVKENLSWENYGNEMIKAFVEAIKNQNVKI